ncbi:hypothetical protein LNL84_06650 [Vibrio sp. ZSDZ34]|jgi:hypothetical protein|uniref:Outer membrane protein beta-barrel domain-containing protein n=1 Tax=Vibrio gelatinilyticus TaxID=2893468 RepID=A0A9X2AYD1_9VIBR|nr:hypothetical protein [Vibrio gelatinilyticus]MCJ2376512.1 hypothetical protein [Vibrio gelatinilyticus]
MNKLIITSMLISSTAYCGTFNTVTLGTTSEGGFGVALYHDRNTQYGFYSNLAGGMGPNNDDFALNVGLTKSLSNNIVGYAGAGISNNSRLILSDGPIKEYETELGFNGNLGLLFKTDITGFTADVGYNTGIEAAYFGLGYTY